MKIKGLMAGIVLAILIMTTVGTAEVPLGSDFFTLYGQLTSSGVPVTGATVTLTINGVTQTTVTAPNGNYAFELRNFPNVNAGTSMALSATSGLLVASRTVTRAAVEPQRVDLALGTSGIKLAVDASAKSTFADTNAIYILTISNPGKEREEYDLAIENPDNTMAYLSTDYITVEAGYSESVILYVMSSKPGIYNVGVTASYLTESKTITTTTTVLNEVGGKISGGGSIPSGIFSISGKYPGIDGTAQGTINYKDKTANLDIKSIQISKVGRTLDSRMGMITGLAQVNGVGPYIFQIYAEDNSKSGIGDVFRILVPNYPYSNGAALSTGNIQISK